MNSETRDWVRTLVDSTKTHEQWKTVIVFGLESLLKDPVFFMDLIIDEANRMEEQAPALENAANILGDLGLKLSITERE